MVSFNNIIGHKDIVKHLQNAIKTEKISHSYIFTGRPGYRLKDMDGNDIPRSWNADELRQYYV